MTPASARLVLATLTVAAPFASPSRAQCGPPPAAELFAADPLLSGDLGHDVALSGDTLIAGRPSGTGGGSAYVWRLVGGLWTFEAKLVPPVPQISGAFGSSVDLDGDVAAIGASISLDEAYVARRSGTSWTIEQKLEPLDPSQAASFGNDVAIEGDWIALGARSSSTPVDNGTGAVYVFKRVNGVWVEHSILVPADAQTGDEFGFSVDLAGGVLVAGSMRWSSQAPGRSASHIYRLVGDVWTLEQVVQPTSTAFGSYYGRCVVTDGDVVAVSDIGDDLLPQHDGAIYVYRWDGAQWIEEQQLRSFYAGSHGDFGEELALDGDELATTAFNSGGRYWNYRRVGGLWLELGESTVAADAQFTGKDVVIDGGRMAIGSPTSDTGQTDSGAAYVFELADAKLACSYCTAKVNSQGCTPAIGSSGTPSASAGSGFTIGASQVLPGMNGLLFYGITKPATTPFQGGLMCMQTPITRTAIQNSGGSGPCSGSFALDFNAHVALGIDPMLFAGQVVRAQYWSRDPAASFASSVSDALAFVLAP
jgi:hypothetical protein